MSLKLGDTNIAGTQVLYSTTGNNTDGAMTQAATTTELNLKANDTNVVHKIGDETIGGVKTFAGDGWITKIQNTDVTYNIAPSSDKGASIIFTDKNGTQMGCVETRRYSSNNTLVRFNAYSPNGNWASQPLELMVDANGNTTAFAPESDVNNSIVTTVNKSKAENGYFKFGNGLIIQWGGISSSSYSQLTINFPTSFSNTAYKVILTQEYNNTGEYNANVYVRSKTNTSCNILGQSSYIAYIAVGY